MYVVRVVLAGGYGVRRKIVKVLPPAGAAGGVQRSNIFLVTAILPPSFFSPFSSTSVSRQNWHRHRSFTCPSHFEFSCNHCNLFFHCRIIIIIFMIVGIITIIIDTIAIIIIIIVVLPRSSTGIVITSSGPLSSLTADLYPDSFYLRGHVSDILLRKNEHDKNVSDIPCKNEHDKCFRYRG